MVNFRADEAHLNRQSEIKIRLKEFKGNSKQNKATEDKVGNSKDTVGDLTCTESQRREK